MGVRLSTALSLHLRWQIEVGRGKQERGELAPRQPPLGRIHLPTPATAITQASHTAVHTYTHSIEGSPQRPASSSQVARAFHGCGALTRPRKRLRAQEFRQTPIIILYLPCTCLILFPLSSLARSCLSKLGRRSVFDATKTLAGLAPGSATKHSEAGACRPRASVCAVRVRVLSPALASGSTSASSAASASIRAK